MHEQDDKNLKTMFEKVINELRNIEYALNFFIKISKNNKQKKPTQILSNIDKNSSTYHLNKPMDSSNQNGERKLKPPSNQKLMTIAEEGNSQRDESRIETSESDS